MAFNARDHGLNPKLKPHLKDVNKYVTGNYAVYWRLIGENLKVPNLNTIAMDNYSHPRSNHQCFRVMIGAWLQIDIAATWEKLQKAINEAIEAEHGTLQTGPNSGTEERDKPETGSQAKQRPNMQLMNKYIIRQYAAYWDSIGQNLKMQNLDVIRLDHQGHPSLYQVCFQNMLQKWLQIDVNASWEKLQNAINEAIRNTVGTIPDDETVKRKHDEDEDYARGTSSVSVNPAKISNGRGTQETGMEYASSAKCAKQDPDDEIDGTNQAGIGNQDDRTECTPDGIKKKKSIYTMIQKSSPMYTIVINNHEFQDEDLLKRDGSGKDVESLQKLADYGLEFCVCSENCKAKEMDAILTVVAFSVDIKDSLKRATKSSNMNEALNKFSSNDKIKNTVETLTNEKCVSALEVAIKSKETKETVLEILKKPLSATYHGLMVFIMTHGDEEGKLYGSDGEDVKVKDVASLFNASNCSVLIGKPKLFVIQACRGGDSDSGAKKESKGTATSNYKKNNPTFGIISNEADFLFAYATPDDHVAWRRTDGSPFIQSFVDVLNEKLNNVHLEDALLVVKYKVAEENIKSAKDHKLYKQMPSVVSQMRDKVWFHK